MWYISQCLQEQVGGTIMELEILLMLVYSEQILKFMKDFLHSNQLSNAGKKTLLYGMNSMELSLLMMNFG